MATNLHAMLRYQVIDRCIRDRYRKFTWKELAEQCYLQLQLPKEPSRRSILYDIEHLRSGQLGFCAPIEFSKIEGYYYSNSKFSLYHVPLTSAMLNDLQEAMQLVYQLAQNKHLTQINRILLQLEQSLNVVLDQDAIPKIYFEHSLNEPGQRWIDEVYSAVKLRQPLSIRYKPFQTPVVEHIVAPAFIKEYNHRWYLYGWHYKMQKIVNLALDRFVEVRPSVQPYYLPPDFTHDSYFKHLFGVTKPNDAEPKKFVFETTAMLANYLDTKPIHPTQVKLYTKEAKVGYQLEVYDNYEIHSKLRSFGTDLWLVE